jgi:uncharacterized protein (DUF4415 family)
MKENKPIINSNLSKVSAHKITTAEYDEIPALDSDFFEKADMFNGKKLVRRGRPTGSTKISTTIRFDADVINALKATGKGWQTKANDVLRKHLDEIIA